MGVEEAHARAHTVGARLARAEGELEASGNAILQEIATHVASGEVVAFTTLVLPEDFLARVRRARDPRAEGIALAVAMAQEMLALAGVVGVNLSGGREGAEESFAEALAEIGRRLR